MKKTGPVTLHETDISAPESSPIGEPEETRGALGVATVNNKDAVLWFFSGGTSGTVAFFLYSKVDNAWCASGTEDITGNEVVVQQAGGDRMLAILSAHGGGNYTRSYQFLGG